MNVRKKGGNIFASGTFYVPVQTHIRLQETFLINLKKEYEVTKRTIKESDNDARDVSSFLSAVQIRYMALWCEKLIRSRADTI